MRSRNFLQNKKYFDYLSSQVAEGGQTAVVVKQILPTQVRVGDLISFTYSGTRSDYTALVAATPRAPKGLYTARHTKNLLITTFLLDNYSMEEQAKLLKKIHSKDMNSKQEIVRYKAEEHTKYFRRLWRFWSDFMEEINVKIKSKTKLDSRNFRTFISNKIVHCKVLR